MIVRPDFSKDLPPRAFLEQILNDTAKLYLFLWERKDSNNRISMTWKDLSRYYHKNCFRSNLRRLNNEGLLDYNESDHGISIELVGWDEISEDAY